jgi:hypothetical protein
MQILENGHLEDREGDDKIKMGLEEVSVLLTELVVCAECSIRLFSFVWRK